MNDIHMFETERTIVKKFTINDAKSYFLNVTSNPKTSLYLPYETHKDIYETIKKISEWHIRNKNGMNLNIGVFLKSTEEVIGSVSMSSQNTNGYIASFGHTYGSKYWNKGYATEVCNGFIDYWFNNNKNCIAIVANYNAENIGSGKAMIKAGMTEVGRGYNSHELSYKDNMPEIIVKTQITRKEWEDNNKQIY